MVYYTLHILDDITCYVAIFYSSHIIMPYAIQFITCCMASNAIYHMVIRVRELELDSNSGKCTAFCYRNQGWREQSNVKNDILFWNLKIPYISLVIIEYDKRNQFMINWYPKTDWFDLINQSRAYFCLLKLISTRPYR